MRRDKNKKWRLVRLGRSWFNENWHCAKYKLSWRSLECIPFWECCFEREPWGKSLLGKQRVEAEDIKSERFLVKEQLQTFVENKGELLACGTCMKNRQKEESNFCPIATMKDMLEIVGWADKLLIFGWFLFFIGLFFRTISLFLGQVKLVLRVWQVGVEMRICTWFCRLYRWQKLFFLAQCLA